MEPTFGSDSNSDGNGSNNRGYNSDDNGWFSERGSNRAGGDWETEELSGVNGSEHGSLVNIDLDSVAATEPDELAALVGVGKVGLSYAEIYDSGCSKHLTPYCDALENFIEIPPKTFQAANKQTMSAVGMGEMMINISNSADILQLRLTKVLYSPEVSYTLISVGWLNEKGFEITFLDGKCSIKGPDGKHVSAVPKTKGLYHVAHNEPETAHVVDEKLTLNQFHCHMGHILLGVTHHLVNNSFVTSVCQEPKSSGEPFFCESCMYAKATRKPVPKACKGKHATKFGDEVYSDLWGLAPVEMKGGRKYYITFIDNMFQLTHLYLLCLKSEAFEAYKQYKACCATHLGVAIKILHSNHGGKYLDKGFTLYLKFRGTEQKLTMHDTPSHNSVAEHHNHMIVEQVYALLHASGLPRFLWGEAAHHVVWLMNHTSTKAVDEKTSFEVAFRKKPDLRDIHEWGKTVWVRIKGGNKLGCRI